MKVLRNSEISIGAWEILIAHNPYSSPFQTPEFQKLVNSCENLEAEVFAVESDLELEALCLITIQKEPGIKSFFSKRAIIYGGPVFKKENSGSLKMLLESIETEIRHRTIYTEIRNLHDYSLVSDIFKQCGWHYVPYMNIRVNCVRKAKIYHDLSSNRKRQIKKALSSGATIKEGENVEEIMEFYTILRDLYSKKIKKPIFPENFIKESFKQGFCKFLLVYYSNKIIGGIMFPVLNNKCVYEFYICGLDEEYRNQYPSILATWSLMEWAAENNIETFDFMGAGIKDKDYGVREFKERFGGELVEDGRYLKINKPILYNCGKNALKLMRRLNK
jgi:serine/alanine adding enzyme